jgi:hypothetical protein
MPAAYAQAALEKTSKRTFPVRSRFHAWLKRFQFWRCKSCRLNVSGTKADCIGPNHCQVAKAMPLPVPASER